METPTGDPSMGLGHEPAPSLCSRAGTSQPGGAGWGWDPQHRAQTGTTPGVRNPRHSWRAVPPQPGSPHGAQDGSELRCKATGFGMVLPVWRVWHGFASPEGSAGARGPADPGEHEPSPSRSPGSAASRVQPHPLAAPTSSWLTRRPRAAPIRDGDEDPWALPSLGELLFAFIFVASGVNHGGPQHHGGGCRGAPHFPRPARWGGGGSHKRLGGPAPASLPVTNQYLVYRV